jgi:exopolysaccharide biosynthesis polyprenyl glycosylphosphotransferase
MFGEKIVTDNRHRLPINLMKVFDMAAVIVSFATATILVVQAQNSIALADFLSMRTKISNFLIFLLALFVYHAIFRTFGLYRSRRLSTRVAELADVLKAVGVGLGCFVIVGSLFSIKMLTPAFLLTFWAITSIVLCSSRVAVRALQVRLRVRGRNLRHLLILGTNPRAVAFARKLHASPERGYRLLGFVDDDWPGMKEFRNSGFRVVCDYAALPEFLRRNVIDEAVIYLPFATFFRNWSEVASLCVHNGIIVRLNSDTLGFDKARWLAEEFDGGHYIATFTGAGEGWPLAAKRTLDVLLSGMLLILLAPVLLAAAAAIKLTSPGPVFFLQERIGINKRRFRIYKFRTMVPNAEKLMSSLESQNEASGPVFKIRKDPRITSIGGFLRRSSIDELPQLINVLKGEMSLVGPRPLPIRDYEGFNEDWQRRRFSVKPGITCLWQVNGRSAISFDQWMLLDLKYMDEWSLWLDLKILAKTVPAVLRGSGAA